MQIKAYLLKLYNHASEGNFGTHQIFDSTFDYDTGQGAQN